MEDKIFGTMSFRYGWIKEEIIVLWGKAYKVRMRTSSRKGELPTSVQQNNYIDFKDKINVIANKNKKGVIEFILSNSKNVTAENPLSMISLKEVLFFQNGKYALLFDTIWSEAGMTILCDADTYKIGESYIIEFEA